MNDDRVISKNVTMYEKHWNIVDSTNKHFDFRNTSAALRFIVSEYERLTKQPPQKERDNG